MTTFSEPSGLGQPDLGAPPRPTSDTRVIAVIGIAHFYSHFFILLLPPLFPLIATDLEVGFIELGAILTGFAVASGVSQIPIGFLVDRLGARNILILGLILESLCFIAMGLDASYWTLFFAYVIAGIANGVYHPADYAILSASVRPERMGRAFSLHTFSGYLGFAVAPFTIILLAEFLGWRHALTLAGVSGLVAAAVVIYFRRYLNDGREAGADAAPHLESTRAGLRLLLSPPVLICFAFFAMLSLLSSGINNFAVSGLDRLFGTDLTVANLALTAYLFGTSGGILAGGWIADRTRHHDWVAASCFAATAVLMVIVGSVALGQVALVTIMAVQGVMHGLIMPSRDMIVRAVTPNGSMGKVYGFVSTGLSLGSAIGPMIYGALLDWGEPRLVFYVIAGFMVLSMATVFTSTKGRAVVR